jgi:hypothetical protein
LARILLVEHRYFIVLFLSEGEFLNEDFVLFLKFVIFAVIGFVLVFEVAVLESFGVDGLGEDDELFSDVIIFFFKKFLVSDDVLKLGVGF